MHHNISSTNKTYFPVQKTNNQVIFGHTTFLRNKFNLGVDEKKKKIPNISWTPIFYKHPSKARFIIASPQCSLKRFSKAVTSVKLMYRQIEINYFSQYKAINVLLMQSRNLAVEAKHC